MSKAGTKPVYDVQMTERLFMRLTPGQKLSLQSVSSDYSGEGGTSEFWREFMVLSADIILNAEDFDTLKGQLSERLSSFLVEKGVAKVEPE